MARMSTEGFGDLFADIDAMDLSDDDIDEVLLASAEPVKAAWTESAETHSASEGKDALRDTGDMIDAIGATKPKKDDGARVVDVYPQGKDRNGVRNAEKAFVLNYGSSSIGATHWVEDAEDKAEPLAHDAAEAKYDEILRKRGMK